MARTSSYSLLLPVQTRCPEAVFFFFCKYGHPSNTIRLCQALHFHDIFLKTTQAKKITRVLWLPILLPENELHLRFSSRKRET